MARRRAQVAIPESPIQATGAGQGSVTTMPDNTPRVPFHSSPVYREAMRRHLKMADAFHRRCTQQRAKLESDLFLGGFLVEPGTPAMQLLATLRVLQQQSLHFASLLESFDPNANSGSAFAHELQP